LRAVDVPDIIQTVISSLEPMINKKPLSIKTDFDENLPFAYADPDRVRQVIMNLLSNAIKFTSKGTITLSARSTQRPPFIEVCVSDTGMGIREEDFNKLFDTFTPLDTSATRPYGGVGLGLSICKGLVEMQGGSIWVESKYGVGSKFYFTLPTKE